MRGTLHGFTADKFHELCDKKGPTLSVIKSKAGNVFGGYTSLNWNKPERDDLYE